MIADVCAELAAWLPRAVALLAEPDTSATTSRSQPASKPPWNPQAATAVFDTVETIRRCEQTLRTRATGRQASRRPVAQTGAMLADIPKLAEAADTRTILGWTQLLRRRLRQLLELPAIGESEPWRKITGAQCPYCGHPALLAAVQSGRITCPQYGVCLDADGRHPVGVLEQGAASAMPLIAWADGTTQHAAA